MREKDLEECVEEAKPWMSVTNPVLDSFKSCWSPQWFNSAQWDPYQQNTAVVKHAMTRQLWAVKFSWWLTSSQVTGCSDISDADPNCIRIDGCPKIFMKTAICFALSLLSSFHLPHNSIRKCGMKNYSEIQVKYTSIPREVPFNGWDLRWSIMSE